MDACQFGVDSNLAANQFVSGLHFQTGDDRGIEQVGADTRSAKGEGENMIVKRFVFVLVVLLIASLPTYADNSRPFFLRTAATLNGAEVPAGIYQLSWEAHSSTVRVTLSKDGRFIATAQGTWAKHGIKYPDDAALLRVNSDGSRSLVEIRLAGMKRTIVLDDRNPILRVGAK